MSFSIKQTYRRPSIMPVSAPRTEEKTLLSYLLADENPPKEQVSAPVSSQPVFQHIPGPNISSANHGIHYIPSAKADRY